MSEVVYTMIRVAKDAGLTTVTLTNARRKNAIGPAMINELLHAFQAIEADAEARLVVLTGEGDAFCAGGDFTADGGTGPKMGDYADLLLRMVNFTKPIVARVNGVAMGGGLGLVAASHFAIASRDAKLATPEVNIGLFPMMIMAVLQRFVPRRRLLEMMLIGERFTSEEGVRIGLLNKSVPYTELDGEVKTLTDALLAKSSSTLRLGLQAFAMQDDLDLETALPELRERLGGVLATDDAREGLTAFLEKRSPKWTGK